MIERNAHRLSNERVRTTDDAAERDQMTKEIRNPKPEAKFAKLSGDAFPSPWGLALPASFPVLYKRHWFGRLPKPRRGGLFIGDPRTPRSFLFVFQPRRLSGLKNKKNHLAAGLSINRPPLRGLFDTRVSGERISALPPSPSPLPTRRAVAPSQREGRGPGRGVRSNMRWRYQDAPVSGFFRHLPFGLRHSFVIWHSSLVIQSSCEY